MGMREHVAPEVQTPAGITVHAEPVPPDSGPADVGVTHVVWLEGAVWLEGPDVPVEAGRIVQGRFQCAFFSAVAMSPDTLRAIADVVEEATDE